MIKKGTWLRSIIVQLGILLVACILLTASITYYVQYHRSVDYITRQTEDRASMVSREVIYALQEYPAYTWLVNYWYTHADELDIEYDAYFTNSTKTERKCQVLNTRQPKFETRYASVRNVMELPEEDQKLYAEIVYTWVLTRLNEIKAVNNIDYLFCVVTDEPYDKQFFLISAANKDSVRGTEYEQVYPLGVVADAAETVQEGMRHAVSHNSYVVSAGDYVDYYSYINQIAGHDVLVGLTFNVSGLMSMVDQETRETTNLAMVYQLIYLLAAGIGIWLLALKPLRRIQAAIRRYKDNKDSAEAVETLSQIRSANEIGALSDDVSELMQEMDDYLNEIQTITADKERIATELGLASRIQNAMLPRIFPPFPEREEIDIYASMDPAREVGGDFYDFFFVDDDHLAIMIADVSGKGIPAALFMTVSMVILKTHISLGLTPSEVLRRVNTTICEKNDAEMFVSVWLGILELSTGKMTASNAGHEYPAIKRGDGSYELMKGRHGLVVGGIEDAVYTDYEIDFEPGSKIFVYTDGVPEATDSDNNMFGTGRMIDALNMNVDATPEETLSNVRESVDAFVKDAEQFDDLTMLCLEYRGS